MRTDRMRESQNVEDRRGAGGGGFGGFGGGGGRGKVLVGGGGIGGVIIVVLYLLLGGNPSNLVQPSPSGPGAGSGYTPGASAEQDKLAADVKRVLGDTEDVWNKLFQQMGKDYREPTLVMFTDSVHSACGTADAAVGPFYCPGDSKVYIDLEFYDQLSKRFGAPGDFAQAYVIAHEVGHHVQNLMGLSERVHSMRGRVSEAEYNDLSVRLELQADFFAGVWAHHANKERKILEPGDLNEALGAASAIGDDTLQRRAKGRVQPETFTHGSSEQRMKWFRKGFETGDVNQGDTFSIDKP